MINKKLIHFNTYSAFEENKSLLYDWTIAFIGETKQIYTHGNFYDCDIEDINSLQKTVDLINQNVFLEEGVYIAATDGTLTLPENWISGEKTRVGIAIVSKEHAFIFNDLQQGMSKAWSATNTTDLSNVSNTTDTFDGINNTDILCSLDSTTTYAAGYCRSKSITFGEKTLTGYLGSYGEWRLLNTYRTAFNNALVAVNSFFIGISSKDFYMWTSTEYSSSNAHCVRSVINKGFGSISPYIVNKTATYYQSQSYPMRIFPFYELDVPLKLQVSELQLLVEELKSIKADKSEIPTKVSQLENDKNYIENGDGYESGVYIAVQSGKLIDPNEYDSTTETAVGVAVIDPKANFIIGLNHTATIPWGTNGQGLCDVDISGLTNYSNPTAAATDMDGITNTYVITSIYSGTDCAAGLAKSQSVTYGSNSLTGYLGSAGEWQIVLNNHEAVKSAIATAGGNCFQTTYTSYYWTSTEYSSSIAWAALFSSSAWRLDLNRYKDSSTSSYCVVPFYKIDNETTVLSKINLITTPAGSSAAPIYIDSNGNIALTTYGGGTKVTLNGSSKGGLNASFYAPTSAGTSGYILKSNGSGEPSWIAKTKTFTNVSASSWVDDTTYEDYPYKCNISCSGVSSSYYAEVVFDTAEALSGNYAPVCSTGSSIVTIYSKVNDTITIPTIFATLS